MRPSVLYPCHPVQQNQSLNTCGPSPSFTVLLDHVRTVMSQTALDNSTVASNSARRVSSCRVSGKTYGREDAVHGWLEELERQPGTSLVTGADSNGMMDALPLTPAQHSGERVTHPIAG